MSEITNSDRDAESGRFVSGNIGGPGRKPGSRNKLTELFISDLRDAWERHGTAALEKCAREEPSAFCKIVAGLLPRDVNLNLEINPADFASKFRSAQAMLGNDEPPGLRRPLRTIAPRIIEHDTNDAG